MRATLTEEIARYWADARLEMLPAAAIHAAKRHILDTLAAAFAGADTPAVSSLASALRMNVGSCPLWGRSERLAPTTAALVNGTAVHALELDDFGGCGHSGAVVLPSVMAACSLRPASGQSLLLAVVAGYDVASRTLAAAGGYDAHNKRGWHSTATCGTFGAAAGAASVFGFDAARFADALGIAGTYVGGIWAYLADGAETKRIHGGKAAENGVTAALLAREGLKGPHHVLDAAWGGFLDCYARETRDDDAFLRELGSDFHILRSGLKPYPICRGIHGVVEELLELRAEHCIVSDDIDRIVVHGDDHTLLKLGGRRIDTLFDAQFSIPYCLALAGANGAVTLEALRCFDRPSPSVDRLIAITDMRTDRTLGPEEHPHVEVILHGGRRLSRAISFPKGGPERPLSDEEVSRKAYDLLVPSIGIPAAEALMELVWQLDRQNEPHELQTLLAIGGKQR